MKTILSILGLVGATFLSACGGGGGGGGGESADNVGIRVLHAAIDAVPVDVVTTAAAPTFVTRGTFALPSSYKRLAEGAQVLNLTRANSPADVVAKFSATIEDGKRYSLLFYGDNAEFGLRSKLVEDKSPADRSGAPIVRLASAATGAANVRVTVGGSSLTAAFGSFSQYGEVPAGVSRVTATREVDGRTLANFSYTFEAGHAYTLLIAGEVEYFTKGVVLLDE